jgi:hypothetical protein
VIKLSANILFTCLSKLIKDSFKALSWMFIKSKRNLKVSVGYEGQVARGGALGGRWKV